MLVVAKRRSEFSPDSGSGILLLAQVSRLAVPATNLTPADAQTIIARLHLRDATR